MSGGWESCYTALQLYSMEYSCYGTPFRVDRESEPPLIIGVVTYALLVACTGTPTVPTALAVPYDYASAVARVLGPTIAMSVTILKL